MRRLVIACLIALSTQWTGAGQSNPQRTTPELVADTLADLHGLEETLIGPVPRDAHERSTLWSLLTKDSVLAPSTVSTPASSPGITSVRRLRHKVPKEAKKAYERANQAARSNELAKAIGELERTVILDPEFGDAHSDLGAGYIHLGRYLEAERETQRAIILIPEDWIPYANMGLIELALGHPDRAETNLRRAVQLSPNNPRLCLLLGSLLARTPGTYSEGISYLKYAARTSPEAKQILNGLVGP
jgi:tetratricopeptide (TPR) repeat protein